MWRRTVLKALGVSVIPLTGCSGRNGPENESDGTEPNATDSQSEKTMESGLPRTVTVQRQTDTDLRETFGIAAPVTVIESSVTTGHTAKIRVTLENTTAQSRQLTYTRDRCDLNLLAGHYRGDGDISLLLIATEQAWERTEADCWVPDARNLNCGIPAMDHEVTIEPDEPLEWTFRLWAEPKNRQRGVCMPVGTYRFDRLFRHEGAEASLSFTLSVAPG